MKLLARIVVFISVFTSFCNLAYSQIDPSWEYFHYKNDGTRGAGPLTSGTGVTVDIRLDDGERTFKLLEDKTFSFRKNNGVLTDSYYSMAGFNSTNYTQGQLREETVWTNKFLMNYRLLFPKNHPTNPSVEGGYPLIVMIHGLGERGNAGYWANNNWNPNDNNPQAGTYRIISAESVAGGTRFTTSEPHLFSNNHQVAILNSSVPAYNGTRTVTLVSANAFTVSGLDFEGTTTADVCRTGVLRLLNNDHNLLHGGGRHQTAVLTNTPTGMEPNDPAMPANAFPGFVLFPQNLVGWQEPNGAENVVRIIRLLIQQYNIDPNKIYIHGLSDGGAGAYRVIRTAPWLFSAILPMSAVNDADIRNYGIYPYLVTIPQWIFQGGTDGNPTPAATQTRIQDFRNNGMEVRYTLYPSLGHGVWNNAYGDPDFFSWMRGKDKSNIHVKFGKPEICGTSGAAAELILSQGFFAYQWEKDGVIIPGANSHSYLAALPGTYRARFSRVANPSESDWNRWSDPVVVTEVTPVKPSIQALGSTVFPTINNDDKVVLRSSENNEKYYWYKEGVLFTPDRTFDDQFNAIQDTLSMIQRKSDQPGIYTLKNAEISGCQSLSSAPVAVTFNTPPTSITLPGNFAGVAQSPSSIFLSWTDNSPSETGFELWRRMAGETNFTFVTLTAEDAVSYLDTNLSPGTTYHYKLRAVSNTARSNHVPGNDLNTNLVVITPNESTLPTPPQNLLVTFNTINSISLTWDAGTDDTGIKQYKVNYGGSSVFTNSPSTTYTIDGLAINATFAITVQTEDLAGNLSPPSNQVIGTTYVDGLYYEHSTGAWSSLNPVTSANNNDDPPIDWTSAEFTGKIAYFNVNPITSPPVNGVQGIATQEDFYKIKFDGYLNITEAGHDDYYQFRTNSDDGSMLFIGGFNPNDVTEFRVVNNDGLHGPQWRNSTDVELPVGFHRIVVLFNESTGGQSLQVQYRRKTGPNSYTNPWANIPAAWLRSGTAPILSPPDAPTDLEALASGMTSIDLSWDYAGDPVEFEVYRSTAIDGTYNIINRTEGLSFTDNTVLAGTTYFYKLKSINDNGTSEFSNTDDATTATDNQAPTVPAGLTEISKTYSNVAFSWTASTDNVAVAGYEILINNTIVDSTTVASYMATGLEPGTLYNFTVKAFDASGNKSAASTLLGVTTNIGQMYYTKANGALNLTNTWSNTPDGNGTSPASLSHNGQIYMVTRPSTGLGGSLTIGGSVSKLIVPAGTTLNVDNTISAKIEVQGTGVVNLNHSTAPEFLSISPSSTINFNTYTYIPAGTYGDVNLSGTGNKNFEEGEITIMGNLTATSGIALKGVPSNASRVTVHGDITLAGTPAVVATDNALDLVLAKTGTQVLTVSGPLDLYKISTTAGTTANFLNGGSAVTINIGSPNGGGLSLANGTTLNLGNNHLVMKNAASINPAGETGRLAINGSNLTLNSSSTQNSNLYLDNALNTAGMVTTTFSGSGDLMIQSPLRITDGLKINAGEVNSDGNITLVSTEAKTAYLQEIESNGSITGAAKVERWVSAARQYRYMSSAVANMTVANWQVHMPITGPFIGTSGSQSPSMFYYVENDGGYKHYPHTGSNNTVTFQQGRGYSIFNYNGNSPLTLTMTGQPYQGSVSYTSLLTPGTGNPAANNGQGDGWNLVGNPYASAIQWNNLASDWSRSGVSPIMHIPDNTSGPLVFRTWDASTNQGTNGQNDGIISPGQAFWIQTTGAATMTVHEQAKRTNSSSFYREGGTHVNSIAVKLSNGSKEDEAYVIIGENYIDAYEPEADGMKLKNGILNLSSRSTEDVNLVFNKLSDSFCEKVVPLSIEDVAPGAYSLFFENIENMVGVGAVELTDHFTNSTLSMTGSDHYNFAVTTDAASYGVGRFTLTLHRPGIQKNAIAAIENVCGGTSASIQLTNTEKGVFYYASLQNDETPLSEIMVGDDGSVALNVPVSALQTGANSLVVRTGFSGCSNEMLSDTPLEFTYTPAPTVSVDQNYYSLCDGAQVTLKAESNPENSLRWYKDGVWLKEQTSASWLSDPITSTTRFEVAAVVNGCEGEKTTTYVEINAIPMPMIEFDGDVLEVVNDIPFGTFMQWYKDNEPLDAYDYSYKPIEEGQYTVLVSSGGCSKISDPIEYLITSTDNPLHNGFNVYVYPNPATYDQLYVKVETTSTLEATISLVDLTGRNVFDASIKGTQVNGVHKLKVSQETAPGVYIMFIRQGNAVLQRKVILKFE